MGREKREMWKQHSTQREQPDKMNRSRKTHLFTNLSELLLALRRSIRVKSLAKWRVLGNVVAACVAGGQPTRGWETVEVTMA